MNDRPNLELVYGDRGDNDPQTVKPTIKLKVTTSEPDGSSSEKVNVRFQLVVDTPDGQVGLCTFLDQFVNGDDPPASFGFAGHEFQVVKGDVEKNRENISKLMVHILHGMNNAIYDGDPDKYKSIDDFEPPIKPYLR